jgi:hypothetical protein
LPDFSIHLDVCLYTLSVLASLLHRSHLSAADSMFVVCVSRVFHVFIRLQENESICDILDRRMKFNKGDVSWSAIIFYSISLLYTSLCHERVEWFVLATISQSMKVHLMDVPIA